MNDTLVLRSLGKLIDGQNQQNCLLKDLINKMSQAGSLQTWQEANPGLAKDCHRATQVLGKVQKQFLQDMTEEIMRDGDSLSDDFMLREFIDKYGQRLVYLNGIVAHLAQLGAE